MSSTKLTWQEVKIILMVICVGITTFFGIDMHLPSLPSMVTALHTTRTAIQSSVTIYLLGMVVTAFFYGPMSDKLGRRRVLMFGMGIAVIGSLLCTFSRTVELFLIGRLIQGVGASAGMSICRSILSDTLNREKLSAWGSYASVFISMGTMISPVFGGYIQHFFGWHAVFLVLCLFFIAAFLITLFLLPETNQNTNPHAFHPTQLIKNYFEMIKSRIFIGYTICSGISSATMMAYVTISPFLFQDEYHISAILYGWLGFIVGMAGMFGKFLSGIQVSITKNIDIGLWTGLGGFVGIGLISSISALLGWNLAIVMIVWICIISACQGFVFANAMGGALSEFRHKGGAAGALYSGLQFTVSLSTAFIVSLLPFHGDGTLSLCYLVLGLIGAIVFYTAVMRVRHKTAPSN